MAKILFRANRADKQALGKRYGLGVNGKILLSLTPNRQLLSPEIRLCDGGRKRLPSNVSFTLRPKSPANPTKAFAKRALRPASQIFHMFAAPAHSKSARLNEVVNRPAIFSNASRPAISPVNAFGKGTNFKSYFIFFNKISQRNSERRFSAFRTKKTPANPKVKTPQNPPKSPLPPIEKRLRLRHAPPRPRGKKKTIGPP